VKETMPLVGTVTCRHIPHASFYFKGLKNFSAALNLPCNWIMMAHFAVGRKGKKWSGFASGQENGPWR
jgi:hypothetical protein